MINEVIPMADTKLYDPIEFYRYEKSSDDILNLGKNAILKFNVGLAKNVNNTRYFFYKEFQYEGKNSYPSVVIKRSFDYYMSIENLAKQPGRDKAFIRIGVREFTLFEKAIEVLVSWFTDKKYSKLFVNAGNGKISMTAPIPTHRIDGLPMDKWLLFEPIIIDGLDFQEPGVRLTLSEEGNYSDLTIDTIFGLQHILRNMNMFTTAQIMLASMPAPIGLNRVNLGDGTSSTYSKHINKEYDKTSSINGRRIGGNKIEGL